MIMKYMHQRLQSDSECDILAWLINCNVHESYETNFISCAFSLFTSHVLGQRFEYPQFKPHKKKTTWKCRIQGSPSISMAFYQNKKEKKREKEKTQLSEIDTLELITHTFLRDVLLNSFMLDGRRQLLVWFTIFSKLWKLICIHRDIGRYAICIQHD